MDELDNFKRWIEETKRYKGLIREALKLKPLLKKKGIKCP